jgi:putative nucleotidyltransferase with HDIG domain
MYRSKFFGKASAQSRTINIITKTLFEKNNREMLHSERVSKLCELVAKKLEFNEERLEMLKTAGLMHDIGKIAINESILNKNGKLSLEELVVVRTHPEIGFRILSSVNEFCNLSECVLQHHEKWDGSGYPQSLKGEEILVEARILALADTYDAMTSLRTYRNILEKDEAITEIRKCLGSHFDPEIGNIFIAVLNENSDI